MQNLSDLAASCFCFATFLEPHSEKLFSVLPAVMLQCFLELKVLLFVYKSKALLLGRARGGGVSPKEISLLTCAQALRGQVAPDAGYGWQEATCLGYSTLDSSCAG